MAETIPLSATNGATREPRPPREEEPTPQGAPRDPVDPAPREPRPRSPQDRKLAASIAEMYQAAGMIGYGIAQQKQDQGLGQTSANIMENSEAIAEAWMDLADKNPKIKAALKSITEVSAIGAVVGLHVTCVLPFLASRGIGGPLVANMAASS